MAERNAISVIASELKTLEVYDTTNSEWLVVPGVGDTNMTGGGRTGRSVGGDGEVPVGLVSNAQVPQFEAALTVAGEHAAWTVINESYRNATRLEWRLTTRSVTLFRSGQATAAIATDGGVTFAAVQNTGRLPGFKALRIGAAIKVGSARYFIKSVDRSMGVNSTEVLPAPTSAVSAADCTIETVSKRWSFDGAVTNSPSIHFNMAQGGELAGTLMVQPDSDIEDPTIVV